MHLTKANGSKSLSSFPQEEECPTRIRDYSLPGEVWIYANVAITPSSVNLLPGHSNSNIHLATRHSTAKDLSPQKAADESKRLTNSGLRFDDCLLGKFQPHSAIAQQRTFAHSAALVLQFLAVLGTPSLPPPVFAQYLD